MLRLAAEACGRATAQARAGGSTGVPGSANDRPAGERHACGRSEPAGSAVRSGTGADPPDPDVHLELSPRSRGARAARDAWPESHAGRGLSLRDHLRLVFPVRPAQRALQQAVPGRCVRAGVESRRLAPLRRGRAHDGVRVPPRDSLGVLPCIGTADYDVLGQPIILVDGHFGPLAVSPDGTRLYGLYRSLIPSSTTEVLVIDALGPVRIGDPVPMGTESQTLFPDLAVSPDGSHVYVPELGGRQRRRDRRCAPGRGDAADPGGRPAQSAGGRP